MSNYLTEKWEPILGHQDLPEIKDTYRKAVTAQLLENQERYLREQSAMGVNAGLLTENQYTPTLQGGPPTQNTNPAGDTYADGVQMPGTAIPGEGSPGFSSYSDGRGPVAGFDPVMISLIRRSMPNLIAYDVCGVQPMTGPTGLIFAMRSMYDGPMGPNEAFFDEPDPTFSNGYGLPTAAGTAYAANNNTRFGNPPYDYVPGEVPFSHQGDGVTPIQGYDPARINANPGLLESADPGLNAYTYSGRVDADNDFIDKAGAKIAQGKTWDGYNIKTEEIVDMKEAGIIDPTKVARAALQNAASVAGTVLLTECTVVNELSEDSPQQQMDPSMMGY